MIENLVYDTIVCVVQVCADRVSVEFVYVYVVFLDLDFVVELDIRSLNNFVQHLIRNRLL